MLNSALLGGNLRKIAVRLGANDIFFFSPWVLLSFFTFSQAQFIQQDSLPSALTTSKSYGIPEVPSNDSASEMRLLL